MTSTKSQIVYNFHNYVIELLTAMEEAFPQNTKLKTYNKNYTFLYKSNPLQPIQYFINNVYIHKEHILNKNIKFFMNYDYKKSTNNEYALLEVLQIKEMWNCCSKEDQEENSKVLFDYLKLLVFFSEKYSEIAKES